MNARELRIGNVIQLIDGEIVTVFGIEPTEIKFQGKKIGSLSIGHFKPVALTEEWLVKFGRLYPNTEYFDLAYLGIKIRYVHQLQNLYQALTGEELTIK